MDKYEEHVISLRLSPGSLRSRGWRLFLSGDDFREGCICFIDTLQVSVQSNGVHRWNQKPQGWGSHRLNETIHNRKQYLERSHVVESTSGILIRHLLKLYRWCEWQRYSAARVLEYLFVHSGSACRSALSFITISTFWKKSISELYPFTRTD